MISPVDPQQQQPLPNQTDMFLLVSYPKSGNTWLRAFLTALSRLAHSTTGHTLESETIDINGLIGFGFNSRLELERNLGIDTADLSQAELLAMQAQGLFQYKKNKDRINQRLKLILKSHSAYCLPDTQTPPLFSPDVIDGAIYVVRNPLDVALSYANHAGISVDAAIATMADRASSPFDSSSEHYVLDWFANWSDHVRGWCLREESNSELSPLVLRYEDMQLDPLNTFSQVAKFVGVECSQGVVQQAIDQVQFDRLKRQEDRDGFHEKQVNEDGFFRQGRIGGWQQDLSTQQFQSIVQEHSQLMQWLGYLDSDNKPTELICGG